MHYVFVSSKINNKYYSKTCIINMSRNRENIMLLNGKINEMTGNRTNGNTIPSLPEWYVWVRINVILINDLHSW